MKNILYSTLLLLFIFCAASNSAAAQELPNCVPQKTTTIPLSGDYGGFGQFTVTRQTIANPDPAAPAPISVFVPGNATAQNKVPVIFFAHGFGGTSYQFYETLMRQLASNGYIVVFRLTPPAYSPRTRFAIISFGTGFSSPFSKTRRLWTRPKSVLPDIPTARAQRRKWRGAVSCRAGAQAVCLCS